MEKIMVDGVFSAPAAVCRRGGVREHMPITNWNIPRRDDDFPYLNMVDEKGKVTDIFYGAWNDFDDWFFGNAGRGEKFWVTCLIGGKREDVGVYATHYAECRWIFKQGDDGLWEVVYCKHYKESDWDAELHCSGDKKVLMELGYSGHSRRVFRKSME